MRKIIGIDEAGRGPLAGPVAVGVVVAKEDFNFLSAFPGLNDSKQLSEKKREEIFFLLCDFEKKGMLDYIVCFSSHSVIDRDGVTRAVSKAITRGLHSVAPLPFSGKVFLDGLLHAPPEYEQETIIRGDTLIPAIMLASVAAKVLRDRLMVREAHRYPLYGFEKHKGYGTANHMRALAELGPTPIHRRTFLSEMTSVSMRP